ncbi:MAG: hypothetical protein HY606_01870 [Planctomycetes bacterium]|nr:hypothetical protein [Planctomycetota bacterium]
MIGLVISNDKLVCESSIQGISVYLDNYAIIEFSKNNELKDRLLSALKQEGTLLFSWANSEEILGPKGIQAENVRSFLQAVGNNWAPLPGLSPWKIVEKENKGLSPIRGLR